MFKFDASKLDFKPKDGDKVILAGRVSVYTASGEYQIYVKEIKTDGLGNLYLEFEKLKAKLEKEGLFLESRKKPLPNFPFKIGVISAKEGAAIQDVLTTIERRWPVAQVSFFPSLVQGVNAPSLLIKALQKADDSNLDAIILTRGGGSIEDLWAFNNEELAYCIASMKTPIVSAIGHEVDFTIAEFVSDRRSPTPTAAAEILTPNLSDIISTLKDLKSNLSKSIIKYLENKKLNLLMNQNELDINKYMTFIDNKKLAYLNIKTLFFSRYDSYLNDYKNNLNRGKENLILLMNTKVGNSRVEFKNKVSLLDSLSPLKILGRGYASIKIDNKVIKEIKDINKDDIIDIRIKDGSFKAQVKSKKEEN